jgi:uncharacterized protein YbaR (Trm112 family)
MEKPVRHTSNVSGVCGFTHDGLLACVGGAKLNPGSHGMPTIKADREQALEAIGNYTCPPVKMVMLLLNRTDRQHVLKVNQQRYPDMIAMPSVDGLDRPAARQAWRDLGIRFLHLHPSQPRSFGAFACHLSYLRALRYQVEKSIPLMLTLEVRRLNADCLLTMPYLLRKRSQDLLISASFL